MLKQETVVLGILRCPREYMLHKARWEFPNSKADLAFEQLKSFERTKPPANAAFLSSGIDRNLFGKPPYQNFT